MRFLVVGAGATGGYFGGRLLEAGQDVTFLVRPARAERLATTGLTIASPAGNVTIPSPPTVLASELRAPFDAVILSCKAYDLDGAIAAFAPAVGTRTMILPVLNGMRHLDVLDARFGRERVLAASVASAVHFSHMSCVPLSLARASKRAPAIVSATRSIRSLMPPSRSP